MLHIADKAKDIFYANQQIAIKLCYESEKPKRQNYLLMVLYSSRKQRVGACFEKITLKAPITIAADDIYKYFFIVFQRK